MKKFKIRASACGKIMSVSIGLTESQNTELNKLLNKPTALTDLQSQKLNKLRHKRDNPELPTGAKTYCEDWIKEQIYDRRIMLSSKHIEKGLICEDDSLEFIGEHLGYSMLLKNEIQFENEYMTGEPDAIPKDIVIDAKNSWDCFTFPLFDDEIENSLYEWQGQVYMELTDRKVFVLAYTLLNTPENIIGREARSYSWKMGYGELSEETYEKIHDHMTYDKIDQAFKIKTFTSNYSAEKTKEIIERVELCRIYINKLLDKLGLEHIKYD